MFGPHLLVEAYTCNPSVLADKKAVHEFIDSLPAAINMTPITETQTLEYKGKKPEDWGITSFCVIAESHISIHTFPDKGFLCMDVFSCRDFDSEAIMNRIRMRFSPGQITFSVIERGKEFPKT